jgi:hypothetical protein
MGGMQQAVGNGRVSRMAGGGAVQTKLTVNAPGDVYEQEADQVAERVMRMPEPGTGSRLQRAPVSINRQMCPTCQQEVNRAAATGEPPREEKLCPECRQKLQGGSSETKVQRQPNPEDIRDAGVPLPGGVVDTSAPRRPVSELSDRELGGEYEDAEQLALSSVPDRLNELDAAIEKRSEDESGFGTAVPRGLSPKVAANTAVTPDVALKILDNVSKGEAPFKPELGKGGASWFVTEGNPHTGVDPAVKSINITVEIPKGGDPIIFKEADLIKLLEAEMKATASEAEAAFRHRFGLEEKVSLSSRVRKSLTRFKEHFAESRMWNRVGEAVRASPGKIGEVILELGSKFSKTPGKFAVVADASKIQIKGGPGQLVDTITKAGLNAEPPMLEAAELLAKKQKWAGRVRAVFRHGGRVLIVVAIATDLFKIYRAQDKTKAIIESAGGWAGATAAGTAFAAWFAPADTAGPWAWALHGVGTLVSGAVGYWVGSETTRTIYELAVE